MPDGHCRPAEGTCGVSSYLQRLLARVAPGAGTALAPASVPAAPLSSPLADHDQRLGLPDFEAPVPSVFEEPQVVESGQLPREKPTAAMAENLPADRPSKVVTRRGPDLRLVGQPPPEAASARTSAERADRSAAVEISVQAPVPAPSPLDIRAADLEPIAPPLVDEIEPPEGDPTVALPQVPEPAANRATPLSDATEAVETKPAAAPKDRIAERVTPLRDLVAEIEPAPRRTMTIVPPDAADGASEVSPNALAAEAPEPAASERDLRAAALEEVRLPEQRTGRSINIEQIIIDVHEPQPTLTSNPSGRPGPPATAAAASIIGPLPVRRSTISLFGMRRR